MTGIRFHKGAGQHRPPRRQPVAGRRHAAWPRCAFTSRDGVGLAAGRPRHPGARDRRPDLRRLLPRARGALRRDAPACLRPPGSTGPRSTPCGRGSTAANGVYRYGPARLPDERVQRRLVRRRRRVRRPRPARRSWPAPRRPTPPAWPLDAQVTATFGEPVSVSGATVALARRHRGAGRRRHVGLRRRQPHAHLRPCRPRGRAHLHRDGRGRRRRRGQRHGEHRTAWSFTTVEHARLRTLWPAGTVPAVAAANDGGAIEVGTQVPGRRGRARWSACGSTRAPATPARTSGACSGRTAPCSARSRSRARPRPGWQQADFAAPVGVQPGVTYVVSYHAPVGRYSVNGGDFSAAGVDSGAAPRPGQRGRRRQRRLPLRRRRRAADRQLERQQLLGRHRLPGGLVNAPTSSPPLGFAVVGAGYWGPNLIRNIQRCPDADLRWVCDLDVDRAARAVGALERGGGDRRPRRRARRPRRSQPWPWPPPPTPTWRWRSRASRPGKHVLVEKPLATSVDDGRKLVEVAADAGLVLMCDHTYCYTPAVRRIRDMVRGGELGDIQYVDSIRINLGLVQHGRRRVLGPRAPRPVDPRPRAAPEARPVAVAAHGADPIGAGRACVGYLTLPARQRRHGARERQLAQPHQGAHHARRRLAPHGRVGRHEPGAAPVGARPGRRAVRRPSSPRPGATP